MTDLSIAVLSGFLFGLSFALIAIPIWTKKKLEKEQFEANLDLYRQLLLKKQNRTFEYSKHIRKVINAVHVALLVENGKRPANQGRVVQTSKDRYKASA